VTSLTEWKIDQELHYICRKATCEEEISSLIPPDAPSAPQEYSIGHSSLTINVNPFMMTVGSACTESDIQYTCQILTPDGSVYTGDEIIAYDCVSRPSFEVHTNNQLMPTGTYTL